MRCNALLKVRFAWKHKTASGCVLEPRFRAAFSVPAFSLAELLIVLALTGLMMTLTIPFLVNRSPSSAWGRVSQDMVRHLASVYNQTVLKTGNPPVLASDGVPGILPTYETMATYTAAAPANISYASGITLYLHPENTNIPGDRGNNPTILTGTNNREWLLLDMNGSAAPNSLGTSGDRVLLYIENTTGRVLTARQKCQEDGTSTYGQSFYDVYKGY
jgi:hypothetical protein